jgi:hypothetical protein
MYYILNQTGNRKQNQCPHYNDNSTDDANKQKLFITTSLHYCDRPQVNADLFLEDTLCLRLCLLEKILEQDSLTTIFYDRQTPELAQERTELYTEVGNMIHSISEGKKLSKKEVCNYCCEDDEYYANGLIHSSQPLYYEESNPLALYIYQKQFGHNVLFAPTENEITDFELRDDIVAHHVRKYATSHNYLFMGRSHKLYTLKNLSQFMIYHTRVSCTEKMAIVAGKLPEVFRDYVNPIRQEFEDLRKKKVFFGVKFE